MYYLFFLFLFVSFLFLKKKRVPMPASDIVKQLSWAGSSKEKITVVFGRLDEPEAREVRGKLGFKVNTSKGGYASFKFVKKRYQQFLAVWVIWLLIKLYSCLERLPIYQVKG